MLFTHGREAYRRNSYAILYMFYKNVLITLPVFFFGIFSCFSSTPIYDNLMYQFYNVCFTFQAIIWYAVFDWEHKKETLLSKPDYYRIGLINACFNKLIFYRWYFNAIWQSLIILFLTLATFTMEGGYSAMGNLDSIDIEGVFIF